MAEAAWSLTWLLLSNYFPSASILHLLLNFFTPSSFEPTLLFAIMNDETMQYRYDSENPFDYLRRSFDASHFQNDENIHATDGNATNAAELLETSTDACYADFARPSTTWTFDLPLRGLPTATGSTFTRISKDVKDSPTQTSNGFPYLSGHEERTANHGNKGAQPRRFKANPAEEARRARLARRKTERNEDRK